MSRDPNKLDSSMLKSKNQVTLFVNYSYNSMTFVLPKVYKANRGYVPNYGIFDFIWGVIYEHTSNRYPREWSSYFNTLPMVNNQLH